MKASNKNRLLTLLQWAGRDKYYLFLSAICSAISGLCTMIPYYGIYQLMDAGFSGEKSGVHVVHGTGRKCETF